MKTYKFSKYSGAGNDFIFFDSRDNNNLKLSRQIIEYLCNRRNGIGADGLIHVFDGPDSDFCMDYYNSDGNIGSLCGNGARCALRHAQLNGRVKNGEVNFRVSNEKYRGRITENDEIIFYLNDPTKIKLNIKLNIFNTFIKASYIDTGSPHVVINIDGLMENQSDFNFQIDDLNQFPVFEWGKKIRYHSEFMPEGTNVNFIKITDGKILIRTFERGVEAETMACGTGSVASAVIAAADNLISSPVELKTFGGEILTVSFDKKNNIFTNVSLSGPAQLIFNGEINLNI